MMLNNVKITEIDLEFVKNYLKVDYEDDDILLFTMLAAAKSYIQSYLNRTFEDFEEDIPLEFSIACLALVAHWYEKREVQSEKTASTELKYIFSGLLDLHRNWNAVEDDCKESSVPDNNETIIPDNNETIIPDNNEEVINPEDNNETVIPEEGESTELG